MAYELGHANNKADGTRWLDDGPNQMNNANQNENSARVANNLPSRKSYTVPSIKWTPNKNSIQNQ